MSKPPCTQRSPKYLRLLVALLVGVVGVTLGVCALGETARVCRAFRSKELAWGETAALWPIHSETHMRYHGLVSQCSHYETHGPNHGGVRAGGKVAHNNTRKDRKSKVRACLTANTCLPCVRTPHLPAASGHVAQAPRTDPHSPSALPSQALLQGATRLLQGCR